MPATCSAFGCERREDKPDTVYKGIDGKALIKWIPVRIKVKLR